MRSRQIGNAASRRLRPHQARRLEHEGPFRHALDLLHDAGQRHGEILDLGGEGTALQTPPAGFGPHVGSRAALPGQTVDMAGGGTTSKGLVKQVCRLGRAVLGGGCSKHHGDQVTAIAGGAGHDIETGGTGEAGLHAIDAGIAAHQAIMGRDDGGAQLQRANAKQAGVVGKIPKQGPAQQRHVAGRGHLPLVGQAVGIVENAVFHAQRQSGRVHVDSESFHRAGNAFGDRHGNVVGGFHHQHFQGIVERHFGARTKAHLAGGHARRPRRDAERGVGGDVAIAQGFQRDISGHQFGQGGGKPDLRRLFLVQDFAAADVDHQRWRSLCSESRGDCGERGQGPKKSRLAHVR